MFVGNLKETIQLGSDFARGLNPKSVILLQGPIGAGKTSFVQGIAPVSYTHLTLPTIVDV